MEKCWKSENKRQMDLKKFLFSLSLRFLDGAASKGASQVQFQDEIESIVEKLET